jgi:hypothetical protein
VSVFWFRQEIVLGVTDVLRVQYRCAVVSVFWLWREIVLQQQGIGIQRSPPKGTVPKILEMFTDLVFSVGIGWYFLGILPTNIKGKLGWYILVSNIGRSPFLFSKRGVLDPFWSTQNPFCGKKGFPQIF